MLSDISPTPSLILQGITSTKFGLIFSTQVAFEALGFQDGETYRKSTTCIGSVITNNAAADCPILLKIVTLVYCGSTNDLASYRPVSHLTFM